MGGIRGAKPTGERNAAMNPPTEIIYLYGFARAGMAPSISVPGLEGQDAPLSKSFGMIEAFFSRVPRKGFCGPEAEADFGRVSWLAPRVVRHKEVLETVMQSTPVFPARFGTLFSSLESLQRLVEKNSAIILRFLNRMDGCEEWSVKGLLDRAMATEKAAPIAAEIASGPASSGTGYLQSLRRRSSAEKTLGPWLKEVCGESAEQLGLLAEETCQRRTVTDAAEGEKLESIFHWAFLIPQQNLPKFRAQVDRINLDHQGRGLVFRLTGPWPPYSFCPSLPMESES